MLLGVKRKTLKRQLILIYYNFYLMAFWRHQRNLPIILVCLFLFTLITLPQIQSMLQLLRKREFGSKLHWCRERRLNNTSWNNPSLAGSGSTPKLRKGLNLHMKQARVNFTQGLWKEEVHQSLREGKFFRIVRIKSFL